jgi:hypothetical protein
MSSSEVRHVLLHLETDGLIWRYVDLEVRRDGELWPVDEADLEETGLKRNRPKKEGSIE